MGMFTGKVALVTGGTSGIGRATAIAFAREGARVLVTGRREKEGSETVRLLREAGSDGCFLRADVRQEDEVTRVVEHAVHQLGQLDFAFNNAGTEGMPFVPTHQQTVEHYREVFDSNVLGVLLCMKHEIRAMQLQGGGVIVNNASAVGVVGMAGMAVYSASKHAVVGLTKCAALEVARENIRVNAISPGIIETAMFDRFAAMGSTREAVSQIVPHGRAGTVEEVAAAVMFLCSPGAAYMIGSNLVLDGGLTAQ